ncbi:uncharacterized protein LOC110461383 [Mizuhopecten yessoensis]|uniref:Uncharacterized protein n=1 Tax=Mizuhopecten yessoensis TaxID=6573 RepID=A0A210Q0I3_MIZYE|nr:uncharacterized protein LOC110461383 [Mizuhopecten yessoensis]OWF42238.1 hypothetical protein KP79_PYT16413 [Mizuhopecten yessoensis]
MALLTVLIFTLCVDSSWGFLFKDSADLDFMNGTLIGTVQDSRVVKTSGCAASRKHPGILYIHNDHHHAGATIFAINATTAQVVGSITLTNAVNSDWEDIAVGPCPTREGVSCVFIGDIGTDKGHPAADNIYLIAEPDMVTGQHNVPYEKILKYSFSELGSDALMVDPKGDLYMIAIQRGGNGGYYHIPKNAWNSNSRVPLTVSGHMTLNTGHEKDPVAGDISPDGIAMLVKTQHSMLLWRFDANDFTGMFQRQPMSVPYIYVWQDEAVCWNHDGTGYYTIPEGTNPPLHFYPSSGINSY